ncbi:hypothetical protein HAX54_020070 [Datura stramonium]|uniref:Uncharacterized protein n=1 Tax=Datura stramonium TaxID=4076 RepID=A0ABS8USS3_DATST|nr:hypothetical protein [Datura stramonium]
MLPTTTAHVDGVKGKEADDEGGEGDENERTMQGIFAEGRLVPLDNSIIDGDDKKGNRNQKAQTSNSSNEECSIEMVARECTLTFNSFQEVPPEGRRITNMDKNRIPNLRITNYDNHNYANTYNNTVINIIAAEELDGNDARVADSFDVIAGSSTGGLALISTTEVTKQILHGNSDLFPVKSEDYGRFLVISLGTGSSTIMRSKYNAKTAAKWGICKWLLYGGSSPILDLLTHASDDMYLATLVPFLFKTSSNPTGNGDAIAPENSATPTMPIPAFLLFASVLWNTVTSLPLDKVHGISSDAIATAPQYTRTTL